MEKDKDEKYRRAFAAFCTGLAIVGTIILFCLSGQKLAATRLLLQSSGAFAAAIAVVLGARALDGPILFRKSGRREVQQSESAALVRVWISCFVVIEVALLATHLIGEISSRR